MSAGSGQSEQGADSPPETVKGKVREFLAAHPDIAQASIKEVHSFLIEANIPAGRTTVAEVLQEVRQSS